LAIRSQRLAQLLVLVQQQPLSRVQSQIHLDRLLPQARRLLAVVRLARRPVRSGKNQLGAGSARTRLDQVQAHQIQLVIRLARRQLRQIQLAFLARVIIKPMLVVDLDHLPLARQQRRLLVRRRLHLEVVRNRRTQLNK